MLSSLNSRTVRLSTPNHERRGSFAGLSGARPSLCPSRVNRVSPVVCAIAGLLELTVAESSREVAGDERACGRRRDRVLACLARQLLRRRRRAVRGRLLGLADDVLDLRLG